MRLRGEDARADDLVCGVGVDVGDGARAEVTPMVTRRYAVEVYTSVVLRSTMCAWRGVPLPQDFMRVVSVSDWYIYRRREQTSETKHHLFRSLSRSPSLTR